MNGPQPHYHATMAAAMGESLLLAGDVCDTLARHRGRRLAGGIRRGSCLKSLKWAVGILTRDITGSVVVQAGAVG